MTMFGKRGSAALLAPEESYASETEWVVPEPAPPGTLQRREGRENDVPPSRSQASQESRPYSNAPHPPRYRLRLGVPTSTAGRVALGAGLAFIFGILGIAAYAARYSVLHDDRFVLMNASTIQMEGNRHLTRAQVLRTFAPDMGRNIFNVPLAQRQADLERLPWVSQATVMRLMPDHVRVQIAERTPVAFVRQGRRIGLIDGGGVLLDMPEDVAGDPRYSFPVLTGVSSNDPLRERETRMKLYRRFMQDLDSGGEKLTQNLSEVDVSNPEDVKALVAAGSTDLLVHFGDENFLDRYKVFQRNVAQWKQQYPDLSAVDTRYEHQIVLERKKNPAAPAAGDGPEAAKAKVVAAAKPAAKTSGKPAVHHSVATAQAAHKPAVAHAVATHAGSDGKLVIR